MKEKISEELTRAVIDITGERYGRVTVLGYSHRIGENIYWKCRCDCGNIYYTTRQVLRRSKEANCGCLRTKILHDVNTQRYRGDEFIGKTFGELTVIRKEDPYWHRRRWFCRCSCGQNVIVFTSRLKEADASCGCKRRKRRMPV